MNGFEGDTVAQKWRIMKYRKTIILAGTAFSLQLTALLAAFGMVLSQWMVMTTYLYSHEWDIFWIPPIHLFLSIGYSLILYGIFWGILVKASKRQGGVKVVGIVFVVALFLLERIVGNIETYIMEKQWDKLFYEQGLLRDKKVSPGELCVFYSIVRNVASLFGSLAFAALCIAAGSALMIEKERKS